MTKPSQGVTISNSSEPYKTVHQNKSELEQFYSKDSIIEAQERLIGLLERNEKRLFSIVSDLSRYAPTLNHDVPTMEEYEYGEYVKIEDILNLFSAQKA